MTLSGKQVVFGAAACIALKGIWSMTYNTWLRTGKEPALTYQEAYTIMHSIIADLDPVMKECAELARTVQSELQSGFGPIPEESEMMRLYIGPKFKSSLIKIQDKYCNEYNVNEWDLEEALISYGAEGKEGATEIIKLGQDLAKIMQTFGVIVTDAGGEGGAGGGGGGGQQGMTIVDVLNSLAKSVLTSVAQYCKQYVEVNGTPTSQEEIMQCAQGLEATSAEVQKAFLAQYGINEQTWMQLIQQSASDPKVIDAFNNITQGVQAITAQYGIQIPGM